MAGLRGTIEELKSGDPLARVTVVVPTLRSASWRRKQIVGLANVHIATLAQLAEEIATPSLIRNRRPLTPTIRFQAARLALKEAPGEWAGLADHRSTAEHLMRRRDQPDATAERYRAITAGFYDEADILRAAAHVMRADRPSYGLFIRDCLPSLSPLERAFADSLEAVEIALPDSRPEVTCWWVPDAEQEVRAAIAEILTLASEGVPLQRMALLATHRSPYAAISREQLDGSGIPFWGGRGRAMSQSAPARCLLGFLELASEGFRRADLVEWVTSTTLCHEGQTVPGHVWADLCRKLGPFEGLRGWPNPIAGFLGRVARDAASLPESGRWIDYRDWALRIVEHYLEPSLLATLDAQVVCESIRSIGSLDALPASATRADFRAVLEYQLDAPCPVAHEETHGLMIGTLDDAIGLEFDAVFLIGMAERLLPSAIDAGAERERALYDSVRASCRRWHLLCPRTDLRSRRESAPSPWFLEEAARSVGSDRLDADALAGLETTPRFRRIASFPHALSVRPPCSLQELDLRFLGDDPNHPLQTEKREAIERAWKCLAERRAENLSEWDGVAVAPEFGTLSASALEEYATCPFRFYLRRVLQLDPPQDQERSYVLDPRDKGTLIHRVLREFYSEMPSLGPDDPWPSDQRQRMAEIALQHLANAGCDDTPLWASERQSILADLDALLTQDDAFRNRNRCRPLLFEAEFGKATPLHVRVDDVEVPLVGVIDRIDVSEGAPSKLFIVDYKTGRGTQHAGITKADPLNRGRNLQLPIYALGAESLGLVDGKPEIEASYWFVRRSTAGSFKTLSLTDEVRARFDRCLTVTVRGIRSGHFPMIPGPPDRKGFRNCSTCDFRSACPSDPGAVWARNRTDPRLGELVAMAEGADD